MFEVVPPPSDSSSREHLVETVAPAAGDESRVEEALRESEERYRTLFETVDEGFCIIEVLFDRGGSPVDYQFLEVNPAFARQTGLVDAVGKRMRELRPSHEEHWFEIYGKVALTGEPVHFENQAKSLDRWYDVYASRIGDPARRRVAILFNDITERKLAERALRESEARYRMLFDNMSMGFILCRVIFEGDRPIDYVVEEANAAFEQQTGLLRTSVLGRPASEIFPRIHEDPAGWIKVLGTVSKTGEPAHLEQHLLDLGRWFEATAYRPKPGYFACIFQDVTQRRNALDAIASANERLRDADRRKDEFLGMLSHELRNPLAPIRNSLHLLDRIDPAGLQARRARVVMSRQVEHLTRLVDDLLDVTRISHGKIEIARVLLDLRQLAQRTCDDHRAAFEDAGVELELSLAPKPVCVEADPTRMAQVLGNLLQNAVKFTPRGRRVHVAVLAREDQAELSVRDAGIGIEPADLERMFHPFVQAEQGLARTHGGLGLGLSLVKGLVELHGGSVRAESEGVGRGAEFIVRLPLATSKAHAIDTTRDRRRQQRSRTILIVEDNLDAGDVLAEVLELDGNRVHLARDGRSGIALARDLTPDVVLCDVGLPDMSGYDLARALRAIDTLRSTRLIALTGYTQPDDRRRAEEAGFDAHLAKPAALDKLNELLDAAGT